MKSLEWQWSETKLAIYFALAFGIISLFTPMWGYCVSFSAGMILQAIINYTDHKHGKDFYAANNNYPPTRG